MNNNEIIRNAAATAFAIPVEEVNNELAYQSIAEWDSMSHLFFIQELESGFNLSIKTEDILAMNSIEEVKKILTKTYDISFS